MKKGQTMPSYFMGDNKIRFYFGLFLKQKTYMRGGRFYLQ